MISEPELVGDHGFEGPGRTVPGQPGAGQGPDTVSGEDPVPGGGPGGRRRAWLWAVGGALAASAVWAGGLYAYGQQKPDLGGYRDTAEICEEGDFASIKGVLGRPEEVTPAEVRRHPDLAEATCQLSLKPEGAEPEVDDEGNEYWSNPELMITYTLHRKADPGVDFEGRIHVGARYLLESGEEPRTVDGLGERALVTRDSTSVKLDVLDGQATFSLVVFTYEGAIGSDQTVDTADVEALLIEDARALLARLKG